MIMRYDIYTATLRIPYRNKYISNESPVGRIIEILLPNKINYYPHNNISRA